MLKTIIKRSGEQVPFDASKIRGAIFKANVRNATEKMSDRQLDQLTQEVADELEKRGGVPSVEQIQDVVEEKLIAADYAKTAKAYILYRAEHQKLREMDDELVKIYSALTFVAAEDVDLKRENANINADTAMGTMLKYGSEGAKSFYDKYVIPPHIAKAHAEGKIHIHDKDFYTLTETCCQIDLIKLFHNGFSTGHGYLREPNAISSYAALACIAIQANQNEMHGGQSVPNFDYAMAQGVDKTYSKEYFKALIQFIQLEKGMPYDQVKALVDNVKENLGERVNMNQAQEFAQKFVDYLPRHQRENGFQEITQEEAQKAAGYAAETAWRETDKATY
ncbi:MAG TPA: anaerobic ribonucleoside triphosphate reductase, partial [Candidatus Acutalibacter pullicola]|nr:anaerobic ribonucleoside triphosphate reductase [Candidatus Acutalibacter pullicola]